MPYEPNPAFLRIVAEVAQETAELGAQLGRNALIDTLNSGSPGRGEVYQRGNVTHQASKAGDPPAIDTGRLIGSLNIQKVSPRIVRVGTNVSYAYTLEYGTRHMAARPWVRSTFTREWPTIKAQMLAHFRRRLEARL